MYISLRFLMLLLIQEILQIRTKRKNIQGRRIGVVCLCIQFLQKSAISINVNKDMNKKL